MRKTQIIIPNEDWQNKIQPIENPDIMWSNFRVPQLFDNYDCNIICVDGEDFWRNNSERGKVVVDLKKEVASLSKLIDDCNSIIVLKLPSKNIFYSQWYDSKYSGERKYRKVLLKDMLESVSSILQPLCDFKQLGISLTCANANTWLGDETLPSEFYIKSAAGDSLTKTEKPGEKITTIRLDNLIITTLPILSSDNSLNNFLDMFLDGEAKEEAPSWFSELEPMFDDLKMNKQIEDQEKAIKTARDRRHGAVMKLAENNRFKSILYSTGTELEDVVKEMLGIILDWDASGFEDKGRSDFIIEGNGVVYVGEVKGENGNVTNTHLAQLDLNFEKDKEKCEFDSGLRPVKILISNTWRKKPLADRIKVNSEQVEHAEDKYDCLIITTPVFLKLFEAFTLKRLTKSQCAKLLQSKKGILEEKDINALAKSATSTSSKRKS